MKMRRREEGDAQCAATSKEDSRCLPGRAERAKKVTGGGDEKEKEEDEDQTEKEEVEEGKEEGRKMRRLRRERRRDGK